MRIGERRSKSANAVGQRVCHVAPYVPPFTKVTLKVPRAEEEGWRFQRIPLASYQSARASESDCAGVIARCV